MTERTCSQCGKPISARNNSGLCRKDLWARNSSNPEFQRKRIEAMAQKRASDPLYVLRMRENMRQIGLAAGRDPELRKRRQESGRERYATMLNTPEVRAKIKATRPSVGKVLHERALGWCPEHLRADYRFLLKKKKLPAKEAKAIILAQHKAEEAKLTPFERQERALRNGAKLIANDTRPSLGQPADYGERRWG